MRGGGLPLNSKHRNAINASGLGRPWIRMSPDSDGIASDVGNTSETFSQPRRLKPSSRPHRLTVYPNVASPAGTRLYVGLKGRILKTIAMARGRSYGVEDTGSTSSKAKLRRRVQTH